MDTHCRFLSSRLPTFAQSALKDNQFNWTMTDKLLVFLSKIYNKNIKINFAKQDSLFQMVTQNKIKKNRKKKILLASLILVFFVIIIFGIYFFYLKSLDNKIKDILTFNLDELQISRCQANRKLDGVCVKKGEDNLWPVAVMIDNHPDSWPQAGLSKAQIVYNTLAEGGSTRLMAIYSTAEEIKKIGPVRSARPYYLTWVKELNALYAHSGGSPETYEKIKQWDVLDCNEITSYGPDYFWRNYSYLSPHNLFTSTKRLNLAREDWELAEKVPEYQTWKFDESPKNDGQEISQIEIKYSRIYPYDVKYEYSTSTQTYLRFQNKSPQYDELDNSQISAKNLIIQFVPKEIHLDNEDRLAIDTLGSGTAWIFYNNKKINGKWIKENLSDRTMFYDENGDEIIFKTGNIWIEVLPESGNVEIE